MNSNKQILKWICALTISIVVYNECVVYFVSYMSWPLNHASSIKSINTTEGSTLRLLLVADPQLIGEDDEPWTYGWLARWDADRFLHNTYMLAYNYVHPHSVIFLGDLFDEGLKASDQQFRRYFDRFQSVFQLKNPASESTKFVYLSGDNDVGGEYFGDRTDKLNERFESLFATSLVDAFDLNDHVRFVKLDLDRTVSFYTSVKRNYLLKERLKPLEASTNKNDHDRFMVILNHATLLNRDPRELRAVSGKISDPIRYFGPKFNQFLYALKLNEDLNAALVIKGDSHKFYIARYSHSLDRVEESFTYKENPSNFYIVQLKPYNSNSGRVKSFHEISVPTCSYRMGVPNMAYGMLTISE